MEFQMNCIYTLKIVAMWVRKNVTDTEINDILDYWNLHFEAGNISERFDQNLLDYIKYVLQQIRVLSAT